MRGLKSVLPRLRELCVRTRGRRGRSSALVERDCELRIQPDEVVPQNRDSHGPRYASDSTGTAGDDSARDALRPAAAECLRQCGCVRAKRWPISLQNSGPSRWSNHTTAPRPSHPAATLRLKLREPRPTPSLPPPAALSTRQLAVTTFQSAREVHS